MKKIVTFILIFVFAGIITTSCEKKEYYAGKVLYNGTAIQYQVCTNDGALDLIAVGSNPAEPVYIKYWWHTESSLTEKEFSCITNVPYSNNIKLAMNASYTLWLISQHDTIGLGSFSL